MRGCGSPDAASNRPTLAVMSMSLRLKCTELEVQSEKARGRSPQGEPRKHEPGITEHPGSSTLRT
jgi:hypothetical protein